MSKQWLLLSRTNSCVLPPRRSGGSSCRKEEREIPECRIERFKGRSLEIKGEGRRANPGTARWTSPSCVCYVGWRPRLPPVFGRLSCQATAFHHLALIIPTRCVGSSSLRTEPLPLYSRMRIPLIDTRDTRQIVGRQGQLEDDC
jgi:hypothetical protein